MEKAKAKIPHEAISRIIREHAEMTRLIESFPDDVNKLASWMKKRKQVLEKVYKHS
jgi:hypothetical protein